MRTESDRYDNLLTITDPDALRTSTRTVAQPHPQTQPQSKKPAQQQQQQQHIPSNNTNNYQQQQQPYNQHPFLSSPTTIRHPSQIATPSSSVAATRANSPVAHRSAPVYNSRQTLPATTNAAVVARSNLRALTPQTASRLGAHLAHTHISEASESEDSEESEEESEESVDDDDDDADEE